MKWVWIPGVPLLVDAVVTLTASYQKIFSSTPGLGYWAQNGVYRAALAEGKTSFGAAASTEAMQAVVRNTAVQGTLSILFAVLVVIVLATALRVSIRAVRAGGEPSTESEIVDSHLYAPRSLSTTAEERAVQKRWADVAR